MKMSSHSAQKVSCGLVEQVLQKDTSIYRSLPPAGLSKIDLTTTGEFVKPTYRPFSFLTRDRTMMFNTGDIVRWREDGCLETFGRIDDQVKIKVCSQKAGRPTPPKYHRDFV